MIELSTADLARIAVAAEAVAAAAKAEIDERARTAHAGGDKLSVESLEGDVTAYATTTHDRLNIVDLEALYGFLIELYPHNFETRTVTTTQPINPAWVGKLLESWLPDVLKGDLECPPGVRLVKGGEFHSTTVRPKNGVKPALQAVARERLQAGEIPMLQRGPLEITA